MIKRFLSVFLLAYVLGFVIFAVTLPQPGDDQPTDAIIVVTGGAKRIERGLALLEAKKAKKMLISGVDPTVRPVELAARYKKPMALFECCIDLGREAVDTRSNADETARWLERSDYRTVRLVTTDWHMPRARFELQRALPANMELRVDAVRSNPSLGVLMKEYNKYLLRRVSVLAGY